MLFSGPSSADKSHSSCSSNIKNECSLCFIPLQKTDRKSTPNCGKLYEICRKYLHTAITNETEERNLQFCSKCFEFANELAEISEQLELLHRKATDLVPLFTLGILQRRGTKEEVDDEGGSKLRKSKKDREKLVELDLSVLPDFNFCYTTPPLAKYQEDTEMGFLAKLAVDNQNIEIEAECIIKTENEEQDANYDNNPEIFVENYEDDENLQLSSSIHVKKKNEIAISRTQFENNFLPVVKLRRLRLSANGKLVRAQQKTRKSHIVGSLTEPEESSTLFRCTMCSEKFREKSCLLEHRKNHSENSIWNCVACDKTFEKQVQLRRHWRNVHERPFQCKICNFRFASRRSLEIHGNKHTGEKPFECKLCHKRFSQPSNVKAHYLAIHRNERRFQCPVCPKKFSRRSNLKEHCRTHHKEESV